MKQLAQACFLCAAWSEPRVASVMHSNELNIWE